MVSCGDSGTGSEQASTTSDRISARLFWTDDEPLRPGSNYLFKLAAITVAVTIEPGVSVFDLDVQRSVGAEAIAQNQIGSVTLKLDRPIPIDLYADRKVTESFALVDPKSHVTVGMGCVENAFSQQSTSTIAQKKTNGGKLARWSETHSRSLAKAVSWRATGSIDTFVIALVITDSPKLAASVAITEILTKILIYYLHERVWAWVPWGKQ
jgi:uncharacterized membrane protein